MTKNSKIYRSTALCLALLMFMTSMVGLVDVHYCGGHVKSVNFFGKAKACYEMGNIKQCANHPQPTTVTSAQDTHKKNCCSNQSFLFQADQDQVSQSASFVIGLPLQQLITSYVYIFLFSEQIIKTNPSSFLLYETPLFSRDFSVLFQSFLI